MTVAHRIPRRRAYRLLLGAALRAQLQYRSNIFLTFAGGIAYHAVGLAFVTVIVTRFGAIGGWSLSDIAFLYGLRLTAHGLWMIPSSQLYRLDLTIRTGEFDRYLLRPAGPLLQLLSREVYPATFGDFVTGLVILSAGASQARWEATPTSMLYLLLAVIAGAMVEGAFQLSVASMSFRMLSNQSLRLLIDSIMNNFGAYPLKIFPGMTRFLLTFVVPVAFVAYLPASALLDRAGDLYVPSWVAWCSPLAGPALLFMAYMIWRSQIHRYESSGT
jgi:ABC-2 type transport system permease protein